MKILFDQYQVRVYLIDGPESEVDLERLSDDMPNSVDVRLAVEAILPSPEGGHFEVEVV